MLLNKEFNQGDVVTLKLVTGEEVIGKVTGTSTDSITISKPMLVNIGMDERNKQVGIQMLPYFILCGDHDAAITIKDSHIIVKTIANDQAKSGYIQMTTGLTVATSTSKLIR
jgi:hypothetical protein